MLYLSLSSEHMLARFAHFQSYRYNSITLWTGLAWRHDQWQLTKLTTTFSSAQELGKNGRFGPPPHVVNTIMRMRAAFRRKNGRLYAWLSTEGVLDVHFYQKYEAVILTKEQHPLKWSQLTNSSFCLIPRGR